MLKREKLWGVVDYPELKALKESYENGEIEADGSLSLSQLDKVAGGGKPVHKHFKGTGTTVQNEFRVLNMYDVIELEDEDARQIKLDIYEMDLTKFNNEIDLPIEDNLSSRLKAEGDGITPTVQSDNSDVVYEQQSEFQNILLKLVKEGYVSSNVADDMMVEIARSYMNVNSSDEANVISLFDLDSKPIPQEALTSIPEGSDPDNYHIVCMRSEGDVYVPEDQLSLREFYDLVNSGNIDSEFARENIRLIAESHI